MKTAASALHFDWPDLDECFRRAKHELKLDGVELSFSNSDYWPHCTDEQIAAVRAANQPHGLTLFAHVWDNVAQLGPDAAAEILLRWLGICTATGVEGIVVHGGSHADREAGVERTCETFRRVLPAFEKAGVVINVENHYAYDYRDCQELFSEAWEFERLFALDSPSLRFCFDTGHAHMMGTTEALLTELAPRLNHVHLADNHGEHDDHCPYGHGTVDWPLVFDALQSIGYDGTLCVEFPIDKDHAAFEQCMQEIDTRWR
jgi:sugar phosphate isomerase/epimerase